MGEANRNLRAAIDHMGITNVQLARALSLDPSLVSRYLSGQRLLKAASPQMDAIADYILSRDDTEAKADWLMARFAEAGLPTDIASVYQLKRNLVLWLASDGESLRKNLGASFSGAGAGGEATARDAASEPRKDCAQGLLMGALDIALSLKVALEARACPQIDLFLSSDHMHVAVDRDLSSVLLSRIAQTGMRIKLLVCVSGDTRAISELINTYMEPLVSGHAQLFIVHGMAQAVTNQMHIILPGDACFVISEAMDASAPPAAAVIRDPVFVREAEKSFERSARFAMSALSVYDDNYSRDILEILYSEFCGPGALDLIKDSINPLYLTNAAYDRFLSTRRHNPDEFAWRSQEFARFKSGMDARLREGTPFREILSLARLNDIARRGMCRMSGLYFMEYGYAKLDREGCAATIRGYIEYLNAYPNFQVLVLDDFARLHEGACWQLKREHHIAINYWMGPKPVMVHSDQLVILKEFQAHFDRLWALGAGGIGSRANGIAILKGVLAKLEAGKENG